MRRKKIDQNKFDAIRIAIEIVRTNASLKRIDGANWSVYMVGDIIRVDIKKDFDK